MNMLRFLQEIRLEPIAGIAKPATSGFTETSDSTKLCKKPVVSVHMLAYNHARYIRQAIDGVVSQITDFEYELIIGEDCSPDDTRKICFEYQRKYPKIIRVIWSGKNVGCSANIARVDYCVRGKYVAYCEGDDFWTDPHKLQKQVDVFRKSESVGLCFAGIRTLDDSTGKSVNCNDKSVTPGVWAGRDFLRFCVMREVPSGKLITTAAFQTSTCMVRKSYLEEAHRKYADLFGWQLRLGDYKVFLGVSAVSDVYFIDDIVSVYRVHRGGASSLYGAKLTLDGLVVRIYFAVNALEMKVQDIIKRLSENLFLHWVSVAATMNKSQQITAGMVISGNAILQAVFSNVERRPYLWLIQRGLLTKRCVSMMNHILVRLTKMRKVC